MKKQACFAILLLALLVVLPAVLIFRHIAERRGAEIEAVIARMPLGITPGEATALIGEPPTSVTFTSGVLITPKTMLTADNSRAAAYGPPEPYMLRTWECGNVSATVAVDESGSVAGKWTWR